MLFWDLGFKSAPRLMVRVQSVHRLFPKSIARIGITHLDSYRPDSAGQRLCMRRQTRFAPTWLPSGPDRIR